MLALHNAHPQPLPAPQPSVIAAAEAVLVREERPSEAETLLGRCTRREPCQTVAEWTFPSEPDTERMIMEQVIDVVREFDVPARRLEPLKTAVAEATMNALEHGNQFQPDVPVAVEVLASKGALAIRITDQGLSRPCCASTAPDLDAKLASCQVPRGWGLFLIKQFVDEMHDIYNGAQHTVELIVYLEGDAASHATS